MEPAQESPPLVDEGSDEPLLALENGVLRTVVDLLELLADVPSTPPLLAHVSGACAADIAGLLPAGLGTSGSGHGTAEVAASGIASAAGLLQRFSELTSTPPVVAEDARSWAVQLWERLEEPDRPAGHHGAGHHGAGHHGPGHQAPGQESPGAS